MPFHKFLIVVVGYCTSREISVQRLGAYRAGDTRAKSTYFEDMDITVRFGVSKGNTETNHLFTMQSL